MTPSIRLTLHTLLWLLLSAALLQPGSSLARNGDDWVLVDRFQSQLKQAQAGMPSAMYEVARMYELGRGTEPNTQKAVQWYERAISKGQNNARAQLGVMYFDGSGVRRDLHKAFSLLKPAAEKASATAQYYLGRMYEQGEGVRQDLNQAIYWYKQAAKNGHYLAIDRLKTLAQHRPRSTRPSRSQQTAAASVSRPRTARIDSPAQVLLQTIIQARWQHNGRASGFLPSANTQCRQKSGRIITCKSGEQHRNIGDAIISYTSDATLSGFNNADAFQISYVNTVTKVKPVQRPSLDGETTAPRRPPNIPLGKQSVTHKLRCELQSIDRLVCVKDNNGTDTYTRVK